MKDPVKYHLQPHAMPPANSPAYLQIVEEFTELVYNPKEYWLKELQSVLDHDLGTNKGLCRACIHTPVMMLLRAWPKHSGDAVFPIPHPYLSPREAYTDNLNGKLDTSLPYGKNRMEAVLFLIKLVQHCLDQKAKRDK